MAFNFGAFLGGVGTGISNVVETKQAQAWDIKKFNMSQDAEDRRSARDAARADKKQAEELRGMMAAYGMSSDAINDVLNEGIGFATATVQTGKAYYEAGMGDQFQTALIRPGDVTVPATETEAEQTASAYALRPLPTIETSDGFEKDISNLNIKILNAKPAELPKLRSKLAATLASYKEMKEAIDTSGGETKSFTFGTVASATSAARKPFLTAIGLEYDDLKGQITGNIQGKKGELIITELSTANYLEKTYKSLNDATMTDNIAAIRQDARERLDVYEREIIAGGGPRLKTALSFTDAIDKSKTGYFQVGDVVIVNGIPMTFTGIPDSDGLLFE